MDLILYQQGFEIPKCIIYLHFQVHGNTYMEKFSYIRNVTHCLDFLFLKTLWGSSYYFRITSYLVIPPLFPKHSLYYSRQHILLILQQVVDLSVTLATLQCSWRWGFCFYSLIHSIHSFIHWLYCALPKRRNTMNQQYHRHFTAGEHHLALLHCEQSEDQKICLIPNCALKA